MNAMVCPDDHELLAVASGEEITPEVRSHLDACADCRQRLVQLQAEVSNLRDALGTLTFPPLETNDWEPAPSTVPSRPQAIGKYLVLDVLGRGGQADVYRALNTALSREVVIKLGRRPCDPSGADRDRLLAEGKMLAELDHPYLARVHDFDFHDGHPFLVMEYVRGRTLQQHAKEQRPTPRQAAALAAQLARAVAVAHRRDIFHQDLKPKNVLIDDTGRPHVIDFGMARLVHGWADRRMQPEGGTAAFMAPEQGGKHSSLSASAERLGIARVPPCCEVRDGRDAALEFGSYAGTPIDAGCQLAEQHLQSPYAPLSLKPQSHQLPESLEVGKETFWVVKSWLLGKLGAAARGAVEAVEGRA